MRICQLVSHPACSSKHLFLLKLPGELRDQVAKKMERLDARKLAEYADTHWHVKNSKKCPGKVVAAVEAADVSDSDNGDLLPGAVAAVPPGKGGHKKKKPQGPPSVPPMASKQPATQFICFNHCRWGKEAWECGNPKHGKFEGNGKAGGH